MTIDPYGHEGPGFDDKGDYVKAHPGGILRFLRLREPEHAKLATISFDTAAAHLSMTIRVCGNAAAPNWFSAGGATIRGGACRRFIRSQTLLRRCQSAPACCLGPDLCRLGRGRNATAMPMPKRLGPPFTSEEFDG